MLRLLVLFGLFAATSAFAVETRVSSRGLDAITLVLDFTDDDFKLEDVETPRGKFVQFANTDYLPADKIGTPDIPYLRRWFLIKGNATYNISYSATDAEVRNNVRLMPIQRDIIDDGRARPFDYRRAAYQRNHWFGSETVTYKTREKLGALTMLPVSIAMAQFNPRLQQLKMYRHIEIRIELVSEDENIPNDPIERVTDFQISQATALAVNGGDAPMEEEGQKSVYLVVTSEDLLPYAQAISDFHASEEREVKYEVVAASTTSTQIRDLIKKHYNETKLEAVLIFGDEKKVRLHNWTSSLPGDSYYSFVSGNDYIADISLGRLPVSNADEAEILLQKYGFYRQQTAAGYSNKNIMMVAHRENYPGKYTNNLETVRKADNPKQLTFNTQYGGAGASNSSVLELAKTPHAIINYRGHGSNTSWTGWGGNGSSFGFSQVQSMANINEGMSVIFNIACNNGAIQSSSDSLTERMLFDTTNGLLRGAIGVIAATIPSLTDVNHKYNINLFQAIQTSDNLTLGNINALAANKIVRDNGGSAPSNVKMYILFADPLLRPWL